MWGPWWWGSAAVTMAGWVAGYAVLVALSRPHVPHAAGRPVEWPLPTPALAALLWHSRGWSGHGAEAALRTTRLAAAATVVDLGDRGLLRFEQGGQWVRLGSPAAPADPRRNYEQHVLDHVAARARLGGGAVPTGALRLESDRHAQAWHEVFGERLLAEARRSGLMHDPVPSGLRVLVRLALLIPIGAAVAAAASGPDAGAVVALVLVAGWVAITRPLRLLSRPVPTRAGAEAVAACVAMASRGGADRLGRRAGFALALGPARAPSPLDVTTRSQVWSNRDGQWRPLRVISRRGLLAGSEPRTALWTIPVVLVFLGVWAVLLGGFTLHLTPGAMLDGWPVALLLTGWVLWALGSFVMGRFAWRGLYDLSHPPRTVEGPVVFLRSTTGDADSPDTFHVAVDDGRSDRAVEYEIDRRTHDRLRHGTWVRMLVTPKLGHLRQFDVLATPATGPSQDGHRG